MIKKKVTEKIIILEFDNQREMSLTFLRFQEHYESPEFAGKIFTHDEFKEWYKKDGNRKFDYHIKWRGFNIPSSILDNFYKGKFNPLTKYEKKLLSLLEEHKGNYYIIAHLSTPSKKSHILNHELAHGLFYTNKEYKKEITKELNKHDMKELKEKLISSGHYHKNVLDDELQAYSISLSHTLGVLTPKNTRKELKKIFHKYLKEMNLPTLT